MRVTLEEFLKCPATDVSAVAPETVLFAAANARRTAVLNNISAEFYVQWVTRQMANVVPQFFRLGVRDLVVPILGRKQLAEHASGFGYGQSVDWIKYFASDPKSDMVITAFEQKFNIRMFGTAIASIDEISEISKYLLGRYSDELPTLWLYVTGSNLNPWSQILDLARANNNATRDDIVKIICGERISPIKLFIGSGKWMISPEIIHPLLFDDDIHCYWVDGPGIYLNEVILRRVIYDMVFSRNTYNETRKDRYDNVGIIKENRNSIDVLGIGHQKGGFWILDRQE